MRPRFRFVDAAPFAGADPQFWRDAEAADRLGSRFKANLFLRELCRSKAWDGVTPTADNHREGAKRERALLEAVRAKGYGVFGPDLDEDGAAPLAHAG